MTEKNEAHSYSIIVEHLQDFEFRVRFDKPQFSEFVMDEPEPLGKENGPNGTRVLAAAIGNCLSASLMFCLQRSKIEVNTLQAKVTPTVARNEEGRWRIQHIDAKISIKTSKDDSKRFQRCVEIFENYCIVTSSVRQGIPVDVKIMPLE